MLHVYILLHGNESNECGSCVDPFIMMSRVCAATTHTPDGVASSASKAVTLHEYIYVFSEWCKSTSWALDKVP